MNQAERRAPVSCLGLANLFAGKLISGVHRRRWQSGVLLSAAICVAASFVVREAAQAEPLRNISIDGDFSDWATVPSFYDPVSGPGVLHDGIPDTHDTDQSNSNDIPAYVNHPDIDLVEYKFTHDESNVYAYFRTTGLIGNTISNATQHGRYYVIVTVDVDDDEATGYPLHEGGYYPTSYGYDMNMEVEFYDGAFNTGHYLNHGARNQDELDAAIRDQTNGIVRVLPGTYDFYSQWVWFDGPTSGTYRLPPPDDFASITFVADKGPVFQGIVRIARSPDGHEAEMVAPFRGFMRDPSGNPIISLGKTINVSFSLEASPELAPPPSDTWASDTGDPITSYYLSPFHDSGLDLALGMIEAPDPVIIGSNLTYTITVTNYGPDRAKGVVLNQALPAGVVFVSASTSQGSCLHSGGSVSCGLGNMDAGTTATVTVIVSPTTPGLISSTASVASNQPDSDPLNNSISVSTLVNPPSSELSIGLADAPDPVELGGVLTYAVSVTNHGPSMATGVFVTNTLPASALFGSAESTQGSCVNNGGTVVCSLGSLAAGSRAGITIAVSPIALGTITATAVVRANQLDPFAANNTAITSTSVSPSSDLAASLTDAPDPVVVGSNLVYEIAVTNLGPSPATSVILNQTLPANVRFLSAAPSQGACTNSGNIVTCSLGTLPPGARATASVVVTTTNVGTLSSTAGASSSQSDPHAGNNSATVLTTVTSPFVSIVAAGSTLTAESRIPANGAIDLGETVTLELRLRNAGNVNNTNLVATLQPTGGVTSPSGSQTYGILPPGGFPVSKPFTFTASGTNGGAITATLQLQDGPNHLGNVTFDFFLPSVRTFSNSAAIAIPESGAATSYPSLIAVAGVTGLVSQVTVALANITHTFADDLDVLLVGPAGQRLMIMSDAGGGGLTAVTLTLDSTAVFALPDSGQITSGTFQPADYEPGDSMPAPAPVGPFGISLSALNGKNPNGTWSLFVTDDTAGDMGMISQGWSLAITTVTPVNQVADLSVTAAVSPNPVLVAGNLTYTLNVTNHGPNTATSVALTNILSASVNLVSATPSQGACQTDGSGVIACNLGQLSVGSGARVTISIHPTAAGVITNTATVAGGEIDFTPANNSASVVSTVNLPVADLLATQRAEPDPVVVGSNLTYTITVTNQGPETALDVILTDPLPASVSFLSADASQGSCSNISGSIVCHLSTLPAGSGASIVVIVNPMVAGVITNTIGAATSSGEANAADNSAHVITTVVDPAPLISAAGSTLVSESLSPANGTIDAGETVTLNLSLMNNGTASTTNLTAKLEATGGVISPSSDQLYGSLAPGGPAVARPFQFVAYGTNGGAITATLTLSDHNSFLGTVTFNYPLPATTTFANVVPITTPQSGPATPYPSTITVVGLEGLIGKVTVTLNDLSHAFPDDLDILLVGPEGQELILMSDTGGGRSLTHVTLLFDDAATRSLPNAAQVVTGTFKPTDFETGDAFAAPAPVGPYEDWLSVFNATDPNGTWSLYVMDDAVGDSGSIAGGWSLGITVLSPISAAASLGSASISTNGQFHLTLTGQPGQTYIIEASINLQTWTPVSTNAAAANGVLYFTDPDTPDFTQRFYRSRTP